MGNGHNYKLFVRYYRILGSDGGVGWRDVRGVLGRGQILFRGAEHHRWWRAILVVTGPWHPGVTAEAGGGAP